MPTPGPYLRPEVQEPILAVLRYNMTAAQTREPVRFLVYERAPLLLQRMRPSVKRVAGTPGRRVVQEIDPYDFIPGAREAAT